jgi:lipopolysaccharide assembly outer membrane protein LptD (OstA)
MHTKAPRLHFSIPPTESTGRVELTASSADRDLSAQRNISSAENEAVLQLRGNVEVMMCSPGGHGCDNGAMVLHADVVDYNEKTHEIDAHGDVHIDPYRSQPQNTIIPR